MLAKLMKQSLSSRGFSFREPQVNMTRIICRGGSVLRSNFGKSGRENMDAFVDHTQEEKAF